MDLQDAYLGHFQDYILVGLTPFFKKARQPIPQNRTLTSAELPPMIAKLYGNKTNVVEFDKALDFFSKKFMEKLVAKYEEHEQKKYELEDVEFAKFERKRDASCPEGRCEYITKIIDEFEGISPKSDEF